MIHLSSGQYQLCMTHWSDGGCGDEEKTCFNGKPLISKVFWRYFSRGKTKGVNVTTKSVGAKEEL